MALGKAKKEAIANTTQALAEAQEAHDQARKLAIAELELALSQAQAENEKVPVATISIKPR